MVGYQCGTDIKKDGMTSNRIVRIKKLNPFSRTIVRMSSIPICRTLFLVFHIMPKCPIMVLLNDSAADGITRLGILSSIPEGECQSQLRPFCSSSPCCWAFHGFVVPFIPSTILYLLEWKASDRDCFC
jgi:hypothetical protein